MRTKTKYSMGSLSLTGAVSMGTAVIIGAGIFALTGQIAELAGPLFPLVFIIAAVATAFSAYSYIKLSNAFPSAGGIAMFLHEAYGPGVITAAGALLMYFSMVINESLVAKTFGTYAVQLFDVNNAGWLVSALAVGLLFFAFLINIAGNKIIGTLSFILSFIKIAGIAILGFSGLWVAGFSFDSLSAPNTESYTTTGFIAATALAILAYKGFTTITNSGSEIKNPSKNVGRAIVISIVVCSIVYALVAFGVAANLPLPEIVTSKNFALAEAARPAFGDTGLLITVILAIIATVSGVIASAFAVSRMLAMLTDMKLVPHKHFGMPGGTQKHTLVYTIVIAMILTVFFDLSRIASLGAVLYLTMDILVHLGIVRHLRNKMNVNIGIVVTAIVIDVIVLGAFLIIKARSDMLIIYASIFAMFFVFMGEKLFLVTKKGTEYDN
jgi:amino acid transporter